jgi:alanine dehydrogenase
MFKKIALAKECESPENPGAHETRVALIPDDIKRLVNYGLEVYVEPGAGQRVGFSDEEYKNAGAILQESPAIYKAKDLVIKFKGPSIESIDWMDKGTTLFCMAHFHSFPERAKKLENKKITVIAMEHIVDFQAVSDDILLGRMAVSGSLEEFIDNNTYADLHVRLIGYSERLVGAIRRISSYNPKTIHLLAANIALPKLDFTKEKSFFYYDSVSEHNETLVNHLEDKERFVFNMEKYAQKHGKKALDFVKSTHIGPGRLFRRIQCLHETGRAGAKYGVSLLLNETKKVKEAKDINVVVLGYGNVAMGAMDQLMREGVQRIVVLTRRHTRAKAIDKYLENADLVINGAELPVEKRGKTFLITNFHVEHVLKNGSVIIDLVGGSATNRSPVEAAVECTYLTKPYFEFHGKLISALWGWPMMGMQKESCLRYSGQITDVLIGREKFIEGFDNLAEGIKPAVMCGPY